VIELDMMDLDSLAHIVKHQMIQLGWFPI